jgi:hypothetical protein
MTLFFCRIQGIEEEGRRRRSSLFGNVIYFDTVRKSIISAGFGQFLVAKTIVVVVMVVDLRKTETFEKRTIYKPMFYIILLRMLTSFKFPIMNIFSVEGIDQHNASTEKHNHHMII